MDNRSLPAWSIAQAGARAPRSCWIVSKDALEGKALSFPVVPKEGLVAEGEAAPQLGFEQAANAAGCCAVRLGDDSMDD